MPEHRDYKATIIAPEGLLSAKEREEYKEALQYGDSLDEKQEIPELEKTEEEVQMIRDLNAAIASLLSKYDLPARQVGAEIIHIVNSDDWTKHYDGPKLFSAVIAGGHIYAQRMDKRAMIIDLSHEMAHASSYLAKMIEAEPGRAPGEVWLRAIKKRLGYSLAVSLKQETAFVGLNEAITEDFSAKIRREYGERLGKSAEENAKLERVYCYIPQVMLMERIYKLVGNGDIEKGRSLFHKGLITGDMSMLKILEKKKKGAVKILMNMGILDEEALQAAKILGFDDVVRDYEEFQKENYEV